MPEADVKTTNARMARALTYQLQPMAAQVPFDRSLLTSQDVGNIIELGHANFNVAADQRIATAFFISGLGLTRDPYLVVGVDGMWVNIGRQQLHLLSFSPAQRFRGTFGLVTPNIDLVRERLAQNAIHLEGTRFGVEDEGAHLLVTCPFGNRFRVHAFDVARFGRISLGLPYIETPVRLGTAHRIAQFYRSMLGAPAEVVETDGRLTARVRVGPWQELLFYETSEEIADYDGHHIMITLADFSTPYFRFRERDLVTQEDDRWQWRFQKVVDLETGELLFALEHEVRSMRHPQFGRHHINRDPARTLVDYVNEAEDLQFVRRPA